MKRVICYCRVATKAQVDHVKNTNAAQKNACREFAGKKGWLIVAEEEERGVSGFELSSGKSIAIRALKEAALRKEYDILLVSAFDRLGRNAKEVSSLCEWFTKHGISLWSVKEGELKDINADRMTKYIRLWQKSDKGGLSV